MSTSLALAEAPESLYKEPDESGWIKKYIAINGVYNEHDTNNKEFHRIDYSDKDVRIKGALSDLNEYGYNPKTK